ncbi:hypothetical protein HKCCE2091_17170 [Rhodobacterales bacterium HKCCE2091]|nr:hypothetical protein [Rhodobacterales bacterium HKCCE2091]
MKHGAALAALAGAAVAARPAAAHTFLPAGGPYDRFVEGTTVVLFYPATFLPIAALGILMTLWQPEGLPRTWPAFLLAQVAGIFAAVLAGPWILLALIGAGVAVASLAALLPRHARGEVAAAAVAIGGLATATAFEGHGLFELPLMIHVGVLFAVNVVAAVSAGLVRVAMERVTAPAMRIGVRVAASWIGAILILMLAFEIPGGGGVPAP